ncbi:serine/threonine-protein phosphatase Pgam5 [Tropilaelaps mercedesae]|uniref:Serine/threonine-protein phosphatase PGAM5, mitochondrial n=1 Tax=Tropilaelaps mercedesae TaxID=418985 RepID=A0A1V9XKW1_9ACAR|nr:serine/threonine-protein phosphatase Pgam5 [Tropilaelaps mercedesae]
MFVRILGAALGGGGVAAAAVILNRERLLAAWTVNYEPVALWDYNWDQRDPCSCVRPLKKPGDPVEENKQNLAIEARQPRAHRHIILIRHGQYLDMKDTDEERVLTSLGREQAELTAMRLKAMGHPFKRIVSSTMARAMETTDIICQHVSGPREECEFLREGAPCPPEPKVSSWQPEERKFFQDGARIEAAFRRYFHRADPQQKEESYELLVCHANVIRYFICRALQLPPEAWLRFSLRHASITWLTISPKGIVSVRCIGEAGYMPPDKLSFQ